MKKIKRRKIKLKSFNNLQKILTINLFDFTFASNEKEKKDYIEFINKKYNAKKLSDIMNKLIKILGANTIAVSNQDFKPYGASSLTLISEEKINYHLDKSHLSVHTYPDFENKKGKLSFRVDIDISTCGKINPLKILNKLFKYFETDIIVIDFLIRGYTKDKRKKRIYNDYKISKISKFLKKKYKKKYKIKDYKNNKLRFWQTKLMIKNPEIKEFFHPRKKITKKEKQIFENLKKELKKINKKV